MVSVKKIISIHPYLAALADLAIGILFVWWLSNLTSLKALASLFLLRLLWWAVLCALVYFPTKISVIRHYLTLLIFSIGCSALLLLVDWQISWYVLGAIYAASPALSFLFIPTNKHLLSFSLKPYRRYKLLLTTFGIFGLWAGFFALVVLRVVDFWPLILLWLASSVISALVALWWWKEYDIVYNKRMLAAAAALGVVSLEFSGALFSWPVGYLVSGVLLGWVWYLLWLIIRFHLSTAGINWRRQTPFLIGNFCGLAFYLIVLVRWQ
jgi:hypothetical protein